MKLHRYTLISRIDKIENIFIRKVHVIDKVSFSLKLNFKQYRLILSRIGNLEISISCLCRNLEQKLMAFII